MTPHPGDLSAMVMRAIEGQVKRIVEEEAEAASKRVKERVTKCAADIAASLVSNVSYANPFEGTVDLIVRMKTK